MNKDNRHEDPRDNALVKDEHPTIIPEENQHLFFVYYLNKKTRNNNVPGC
jgi:hypothetical protein